ncbi:MAG: hypothetical protein WCZ89_06405 [Phycisphaerae bacterium]
MNTRKRVWVTTITFAVSIIIGGCTSSENPAKMFSPPDVDRAPQQVVVSENRFVEQRSSTTALESAVQLSEKYAILSAEASELRQQNNNLQETNKRLNNELAQVKNQLIQAKKELSEANHLLLETRVEMNNWKTDILGFRDEMRQAEIAQLQTLKKILEVLGGEMPEKLASAD